jgi:PAS domain S-box-containing protein
MCEETTGHIVEANPAFVAWTGYTAEELSRTSLEKLVYKKDFRNLQQRLCIMEKEQHLCDDIRLLAKDHALKEAEVMICKIRMNGKHLYLCLWRDQSARKDREAELRQKASQEQSKAAAMAQNILPFGQMLEKLRTLPICLQELGKCTTIAASMEKAVSLMCHQQGCHYAHAAVLLRQGDYLELACASRPWPIRRFHLQKQHKLAQVAREGKTMMADEGAQYIVPITSALGNVGVLLVECSETERLLVQKNENLRQFHNFFLESLAAILGLWVEHLHLQAERQNSQERDALTGHYQRGYFFSKLSGYVERREVLALVVLTLHHPLGGLWEKEDAAVRAFATLLDQYKPAQSLIAYTASREFAVIVPHASLAEVSSWAEQLRRKVGKGVEDLLPEPHGTIPAAIVIYNPRNDASLAGHGKKINSDAAFAVLSALWSQAMSCLEAAKKQGEGKLFYWQDGMPKIAKGIYTKLS